MMKTLFLTLLLAGLCGGLSAQTHFRPLSYEEALTTAKVEGKHVFVDFYTVWCGPCRAMLRDVFPRQEVGEYLNSRFVCIKLDAEKEGKQLATQFKVNAYPTFIGVDTEGKEVMRKVGGGNAEGFLASLERQLNPEKRPERLHQRYAGGERTPELMEAYAALKMTEAEGEMMNGMDRYWAKQKEVVDMVRTYFDQLPDSGRLSAKNLFVYTHYTDSPFDEMAAYMIAHREAFDQAVKQAVAERIATLYRTYLLAHFSATRPFDRQQYERAKQEINTLGLNREGVYDGVFRLIEGYAQGDFNLYLTLCDREYAQLPPDFRQTLLVQLPSLLRTNDQTLLKQASAFIRSHLAELNASQLYTVVIALSQIERGQG